MERLQRLQLDPSLRPLTLARCAGDILFFINEFCWTFDPRAPYPDMPFLLFPVQEAYIRWIEERERRQEHGLAEKSRTIGFTWLSVAYATHGYLFRNGFTCGFGSRKLELVDKLGDPDSIFEKIRYTLRNIPHWMLPEGFVFGQHDAWCKIINPANRNIIAGEGGDDIGRGGRKTLYFVDEYAFLQHPQLVDKSLSDNTEVVIHISTPNGPGNPFANKRFSGKLPVFTGHWKDDPRRNYYVVVKEGEELHVGNGSPSPEEVPEGATITYPWAQKKKANLNDDVAWAQEFDLDYSASVEGITIPAKWVRAAVELPLLPDPHGPIEAGFDIATEGASLSVLIPHQGPMALPPISWQGLDTTQNAHRAAEVGEKIGLSVLKYDVDGPGIGVKATWNAMEKPPAFKVHPLSGGDSPSEIRWPDGRSSKERFRNRRAELWWLLRMRFEKTYEYVTEGISHPLDELISIPHHPELISQLSLPLHFYTETGKIQLETKKDMRARGVKSPDFADALAYAFAPTTPGIATARPVVISLPYCRASETVQNETDMPNWDRQGRVIPPAHKRERARERWRRW